MKHFLILVTLFLLMPSSYAKRIGPCVMPEEKTLPLRSCQMDSDCMYVVNGCCDCNNGGLDLAINKNQLEIFKLQKQIRSEPSICTKMGGGECGFGKVTCESNLCTYKRHNIPLTEAEILKFRSCQNNSDCTFVMNGCCDCTTSSNQRLSVNVNQLQAFQEHYVCSDTPGQQRCRANMKACSEGQSLCVDKLCSFFPERSKYEIQMEMNQKSKQRSKSNQSSQPQK